MAGTLDVVVVAVWAMLPAYVPNNAAVLFGGGTPIDGGRTWGGRRVLGDGKTWRGVVAGTLTGVGVAVFLSTLAPRVSEAAGFALPAFPLAAAVTLPAGAMLGDVAASFLKRRTGRSRGRPFPGVDQLDFVVGALGLTVLAAPEWFVQTFLEPPLVLGIVAVLTPALHLLTNFLAYQMDLKSEPY